jgi:hypothetical protein
MAGHQRSGALVTEPYVLEMMRQISDVVSRRFVESADGIAGCIVVPLADGPSYSGPVGCTLVRNEGRTAEEIREARPFADLGRKEKLDVLDTFVSWNWFREQGLTANDELTILLNVMADKPRDRWLEGTSITQPLRPECSAEQGQTRQHER